MESTQNQKLTQIREHMVSHNLDAYLVFHGDAHQSEYLAPCDERVKFISGFSGSNGLCLITKDKAFMWTDGRYYLQAEKQLESGWEMMKMESGVPPYFEWIGTNLPSGSKIGCDSSQMPVGIFKKRRDTFKEKGIELLTVNQNLVDEVWGSEKPPLPSEKVFVLDIKYTGKSVQQKFKEVDEKLAKSVDALLVTTLDDIASVLNLRGNDIQFNPVFIAYLVIVPSSKPDSSDDSQTTQAHLFTSKDKVSDPAVQAHLKENNIQVSEYKEIEQFLKDLAQAKKKIGIDENECSYKLYEMIQEANPINKESIVETLKAKKSPTEMEGMRNCNIRDCAALIKYFSWLEHELKTNPQNVMTEYDGARKIDSIRGEGELFKGPSFDTISSIGPNGAVIHYKPKKGSALKLNNNEIYLLDSGGQYLDGTTDITRSVHFGGNPPTAFQKEMYTRVLLGVLDLERIVWPSEGKFTGADFDTLARRHLWEAGKDYRHGTGHGVGSFLCVHEGPQNISRYSKAPLQEGMCVSDEPGYYEDGEFGIRIENVIMVVKHEKYDDRLKFENLTVCPYSRELIDVSLLAPADVTYLNNFHQKCVEKLTPLLEGNQLALDYLKRQCAPL